MSAHLLLLFVVLETAASQVLWTPIYLDSNNQVDLWTQESTGCRCPFDASRSDCACCVPQSGCHCGESSPNRCQQCGLEKYCSNMCNITLDARTLQARSNKTFGQIKSPAMEGPSFCWYLLQPGKGQRVEVQIYRLKAVGRFNGTSVSESTERSQFLAYFSFTPIDHPHVGLQPRGGQRVEHTECDWLYQDYACRDARSCLLASPGYPGVYPPNRLCKYLITTSSIHTRIHIGFINLLLPYNHCGTDYIAVYQGSTSSGPLQTTICGNRKEELNFTGPNLLLEFSSGPPIPPYDYNGFVAYLEFIDLNAEESHTETTVKASRTTEAGIIGKPGTFYHEESTIPRRVPNANCDFVFYGNTTRSGHFDTRSTIGWPHDKGPAVCRLTFIGRKVDVIHVSLFNYDLRTSDCDSAIEIFDGSSKKGAKPVHKICSPVSRHARDPNGRFTDQESYLSSGNILTILVRMGKQSHKEALDGAFAFHDEKIAGTQRPDLPCAVEFLGTKSPLTGEVKNPATQHIYWNIEGPLNCSQIFKPNFNQSISISVNSISKSSDSHCNTNCEGDSGCDCITNLMSLDQVDHLKIIAADTGVQLACICGRPRDNFLPISVHSLGPLMLVYSVAHYSWTTQGFNYKASYQFTSDRGCGPPVYLETSGLIDSRQLSGSLSNGRHAFNYFKCLWLLQSNVERQITIEMSTIHNPDSCGAWNISIHKPSKNGLGPNHNALHTFCPGERRRLYTLPWKVHSAYIRLNALSKVPGPHFTVRWSSKIVTANNRVSGPNDAAVHSGGVRSSLMWLLLGLVALLMQ
ncbi:uncharacterized protein LOC132197077 isoform X2 [Neocloeon triangulifer]|uniref:uncharacterized protein LOC132197077 isoform X2 n=1 Tax=Neocloeon triangulifer TaxID=2078957 RepID=UPI00286F8633|nr:uncharacterized protein LOC132197077 isoform X2 [Neocloeon triangulifer]